MLGLVKKLWFVKNEVVNREKVKKEGNSKYLVQIKKEIEVLFGLLDDDRFSTHIKYKLM